MADHSTITLAGGVQAPAPLGQHPPHIRAHTSPAHAAFARLLRSLDESILAHEALLDPRSWDPAYAHLDRDAEAALQETMSAAKIASCAHIVLHSDRALVATARLIHHSLSIENDRDRLAMIDCLTGCSMLLGAPPRGPIGREADKMRFAAIERLARLCDVIWPPTEYPETESTSCAA
ncbi:hypothetical protein [Rhodobacter capsulatus]|uniref:hypothetical protein n=1 Tax=Rhodobacter capsulatus TaxID=1061 RepID=UPI004027450D